mgnify:CR=1 FL=1
MATKFGDSQPTEMTNIEVIKDGVSVANGTVYSVTPSLQRFEGEGEGILMDVTLTKPDDIAYNIVQVTINDEWDTISEGGITPPVDKFRWRNPISNPPVEDTDLEIHFSDDGPVYTAQLSNGVFYFNDGVSDKESLQSTVYEWRIIDEEAM